MQLTKSTQRLLRPVKLSDNDRVSLSLTKDCKYFTAKFYSEYHVEGQPEPKPPSHHVYRVIQKIPERQELSFRDGIKTYKFGATDYTVLVLQSSYQQQDTDNILFLDDITKSTFDMLLSRFNLANTSVIRTAEYFENGTVPKNGLVLHPDHKLSDYQQIGTLNALCAEGYGLFYEQGCGKTPVMISLIDNVARHHKEKIGKPHKTLVVAPNNVRFNWQKEIERFACHSKLSCHILVGTYHDRMRQLIEAMQCQDDDGVVVICGYDTIVSTWEAMQFLEWDVCIADESHYIKSPSTKRWEHFAKLRDKCQYRYVLTGTPIANTLFDLYTQLEFLGEGYSGFTSFTAFKRFFGVFDTDYGQQNGVQKLASYQNVPLLQERLARHSMIIDKKKALPNLPPKRYMQIESEMTSQQIEVYKQLASKLHCEIESADLTQSITLNNVLTKMLRLAEVTAGFATWDKDVCQDTLRVLSTEKRVFDPIPKIETLVDTLKTLDKNEKAIIWSHFTLPIKLIHDRLTSEGYNPVMFFGETSDKNRKIAEHSFNNDPKCRAFIGNPKAGGTGLNLLGYPPNNGKDHDCNCSHVIYYSMDWSSLARSQSEDRANRRGTRVDTQVVDLVVPGTIDVEIRKRVTDKRMVAFAATDISHIMQNVVNGLDRIEV